MIEYIEENCVLPPLEAPLYDEDADTYDLWFDEKECLWHPYPDPQLICMPFETKEEATEMYNKAMEIHNDRAIPATKNS